MFDFVDFVLDVDELLVGLVVVVVVVVGFAVMGLVAVVVVGFLGLRFYCEDIHFYFLYMVWLCGGMVVEDFGFQFFIFFGGGVWGL